jgi:uncharacterized protein YneF (UPF0154 family)
MSFLIEIILGRFILERLGKDDLATNSPVNEPDRVGVTLRRDHRKGVI